MFRYKKTIAHCFCMFSLSLALQLLVCDGNRQTFKDLSHQIIQTTSLEQDLPQQKSTDNNSQWFPLFPCQVAGLCAFSCRRRLSGMYTWPSCIGTAVRECYDVKEAEKCEEVVISSPSLWNSWSGLFLEHESVFFFFFSLSHSDLFSPPQCLFSHTALTFLKWHSFHGCF